MRLALDDSCRVVCGTVAEPDRLQEREEAGLQRE